MAKTHRFFKIMGCNYDDLEGLLTQLGTISALIIGFVIGLNCTVTREEFVHYDFYAHMRTTSFRKYAVSVMQNEYDGCINTCAGAGAACEAACKKQWTIDWEYTDPEDPQKTYNWKDFMLKAGDYDDQSKIFELEASIQLLVNNFPMEKMLVWNTVKQKPPPSSIILSVTWWGTVGVGVPLFASIILYVFLQLSDAREHPEGERIWSTFLPPLVVVLYVVLGGGIILDLMSMAEILSARYPSPRYAGRNNDVPLNVGVACTVLICLFVFVVLAVMMYKNRYAAKEDDETKTEDDSTVTAV